MDPVEQENLVNQFRSCSDDRIRGLLAEGKDGFREGVYGLLRAEARRRRIDVPIQDEEKKSNPFSEMTRGELLDNAASLSPEAFAMLLDELAKRNMDGDEIRTFIQAEGPETDGASKEEPPNVFPLVVIESLEEGEPFFKALKRRNVPFSIQIMVSENNYERAKESIGPIELKAE